ncbi:MAG: hypothetical protein WEB58_02740 [Planctomycetaceae bacterium]
MHPFEETVSVAGGIAAAVVGVVIVLTLFYRILYWMTDAGAKPDTISIRGVLSKETYATVYLGGNEQFDRVRFVGFTNSETLKTHLPYELNGMVILEDEQQRRFLVRAKSIRMIVVPPETGSDAV